MMTLFDAANLSADEIIQKLESLNLGWSLDHTAHLIEARIWNWPYVIGRYRPGVVEPLADMLRQAIANIDWDYHATQSIPRNNHMAVWCLENGKPQPSNATGSQQ